MPETSQQTAFSFRAELKCDLAEVRRVAEMFRDFVVKLAVDADDAIDCELALVEACTNAIRYAEGKAKQLPVSVSVTCRPDEIEIAVTDHTCGFEWPEKIELPPPDAESGRGLFIIQSVMASVSYQREDGENTLTMRRRRKQ